MTKVTEFSTALDWTALTYLQAIPVPGAVTLGPDPGPGSDSLDRKGSFWCLVPCDRFEETEQGCVHPAGRWLGAGIRGLRQEDVDGNRAHSAGRAGRQSLGATCLLSSVWVMTGKAWRAQQGEASWVKRGDPG